MEWFCPECCTWTSDPKSDGCYHECADDPTSPWICWYCDTRLAEVKDGLEYTKEPWDNPDDDKPYIDDPDKLPMISAQYPHATCYELCGYCGVEVVIPAYQESTCPVCGQPIIPCSMCAVLKDDGYWHMVCHDKCPYSKEEN